MMTNKEAYATLTKYLKNQNLIKHCLACKAVMKAIYKKLHTDNNQQEEDKWGIVGLLHDADYELTKNDPGMHGVLISRKEPQIDQDILYAIKTHNFQNTKVMPKSKMDWAITCSDQLTGLIVACALVRPDKKLASLTDNFILKKFKEKSFAKGAEREPILMCEKHLGIKLEEFVHICLSAMQEIHDLIGL